MTRTVDELRHEADDRFEDLELLAGNLRRAVEAAIGLSLEPCEVQA